MTLVIAADRRPSYASDMRAGDRSLIASLLDEQRALEARIQTLEDPGETLAVGQALLRFAAREDDAFAALAPLLDPAAQAELAAEHRQIAEDMDLLDWLLRTTPASPDVAALSASLARRMHQHIYRDGRLLSRAVSLHDQTHQ
jgi:hypothetical protein